MNENWKQNIKIRRDFLFYHMYVPSLQMTRVAPVLHSQTHAAMFINPQQERTEMKLHMVSQTAIL